MRRFLSSLMALAFMVAVGSSQALAMDKMDGMAAMKCPKGQSWVSGHMDKKTHKMTKGYCRKKAMSKM